MDSTTASYLHKVPSDNRGSEAMLPEEEDSDVKDGTVGRPREGEKERDIDSLNGVTPAAGMSNGHRVAAERKRFNTIGYQKRQRQKMAVDFATVGKGASGNARPRGTLKQVLFTQGVSEKSLAQEDRDGQLEVLRQTLETFVVPAELSWKWRERETGGMLEKSWTDIVHSHESMSRTQRHQQEALWELLNTELTYINKLKVITDVVLAALRSAHQKGCLLEVTPELLFSNLPSILNAHQLLWQEAMYPMLQEVRQTGRPFDPLKLESGCLQIKERFSAYLEYCWEQERNVEFTRRQTTNPQFHIYLMWVETHPQCGRMRLGDMQAKPHQRITKYPLLLKAVLKNTQDPHAQYTLRRMLASMNFFLDSINDYLRLRHDELALSECSQRIEGYEAEGLSEEIDKLVKEFCKFDLTCPVRGVGPGIIRKLLLEETLKVRGRRDSKLEMVVLLFTDVLLVTKAQKKSDKLKVMRPPLALERMRCSALKDSSSFVLVEVSDLGCVVSVYNVSTPSTESCSLWISTILKAQESLEALRNKEANFRVETNGLTLEPFEIPPVVQPNCKLDMENTAFSLVNSQNKFTDCPPLDEESPQLDPGGHFTSQEPMKNQFTLISRRRRKIDSCSQSVREPLQHTQTGFLDGATAEVEQREGSCSSQSEENDNVFRPIKERRVTWNHVSSTENRYTKTGTLETNKSNHPHPLLLAGHDVVAPQPLKSSGVLLPNKFFPIAPPLSETSPTPGTENRMHPDSDEQSETSRPDSSYSQSGEEVDPLTESSRFSRKLKSPRIRRRRPVNSPSNAPSLAFRRESAEVKMVRTTPVANSSSNSDSEGNQTLRRSSAPVGGQAEEPHLVIKLGSLKMNRGALWNTLEANRLSPYLHTHSDPELSKIRSGQTTPKSKLKTQRSSSIPDGIYQGVHDSALASPRLFQSPPPCPDSLQFSPLEGLLERAKERERDRGFTKQEDKGKGRVGVSVLSPPSLSTTPSPSHSEGEREIEEEDGMILQRFLGQRLPHGWKEGNVDESEDEMRERKSSPANLEGASVDWPGWCFDDVEVMNFLGPGDRDADWLERALTSQDAQQKKGQEDGECSEV